MVVALLAACLIVVIVLFAGVMRWMWQEAGHSMREERADRDDEGRAA